MSTLHTNDLMLHKSGFRQMTILPQTKISATNPDAIAPRVLINGNYIFRAEHGLDVLDQMRRLKWLTAPAYKEKRQLLEMYIADFLADKP